MNTAEKPRFCFGDTETTGLAECIDEAIDADRQIIEYAFVIWEDGERIRSFERKVRPTGEAIKDAEYCASQGWNHFTGVNNWMNPSGPRTYTHAHPWSSEDCQHVDDFLAGETLAGSNPRFDLVMFKAAFKRLGFLDQFPKMASHRLLDVGALAWPLWTAQLIERTGLETMAKFLDVEHKAHTAMGDVLASIDCFEILIDSYIFRPRQMRELLHELGAEKGIPETVIERELAKLRGVAL